MKKISTILFLLLFYFTAQSQPQKFFHFKFIESNKDVVNTNITNLISIDRIDHDTIYAYANADEMAIFEKLGYKYTILPQTTFNSKSIVMATTVAEMANWDKYPTYSVYRAMMKKFEQDFPALCKLDSIGTTNNGHKIYVVKLSSNVSVEEPEVEVFYTSTIHGDETTGFILMLRLIDFMLSNYASDARVASMLNGMAIYINPDANPDGTYKGGDNTLSGAIRYNANYVDINRNFLDPRVSIGNQQVETQIMMNYAASRHFTLSANFHGGAEVVNYPWDTWNSSARIHADNNWFIHFSKQYADSVQANGPINYFTDVSYNGYTNGGDWYIITGGRQDYMNWWHHCREITIELSGVKLVASEQLSNYWNYNKEGLIGYLESATKGFKGTVTNASGNPIKAKVFISGHDVDSSHVYSSSTTGFYARPIEPGTWQVTYSAEGYVTQTHTINVANWESIVLKDIQLIPKFAVNFDITYLGSPVEGVNINFNSTDKQTLSSGQVVFTNVSQGNGYRYTVTQSGYHVTTGNVDVVENRTISLSLIPETTTIFSVSFDVSYQSAPLESATVIFNGDEQQSVSTGIASFSNTVPGNNYIYSISKLGYQSIMGQIDVAENKLLNINLIPYIYSLTFNVQHLGIGISNADVFFDGIDLQSAADGTAIFNNVLYGIGYNYVISKPGYKTVYGRTEVNSNKTIDVELIPVFDITFTLRNQGNPLANAKILFNSLILSSDINGLATFNDVLYGNGYNYSINLSDYYKVTGIVNATEDKNIPVELTRVGIISPDDQTVLLNVWPNPFSLDFNVGFNLNKPAYISFSIYTLNGRLISTIAKGFYPIGFNTINIKPITGIVDGSFVLVLSVGSKTYSQIIQHIR